jgi:hypothetical protein
VTEIVEPALDACTNLGGFPRLFPAAACRHNRMANTPIASKSPSASGSMTDEGTTNDKRSDSIYFKFSAMQFEFS